LNKNIPVTVSTSETITQLDGLSFHEPKAVVYKRKLTFNCRFLSGFKLNIASVQNTKTMNAVTRLTIKDLAFKDRPREKLMIQGKSMMTNAELLAIIIGSGNQEETAVELSERMLNHFDNKLEEFVKLDVSQLSKFKGIGEAKAITIIAALEFSYRREHKETANVLTIDNSQALYQHLMDAGSNTLEDQIWIILLNRYHSIILTQKFDTGTKPELVLDAKLLFQFAIENHAAYMAVCKHRTEESLCALESDLLFVKEAVTAGNMLGVPLWDFLIFNDKGYLSFADDELKENRTFHLIDM